MVTETDEIRPYGSEGSRAPLRCLEGSNMPAPRAGPGGRMFAGRSRTANGKVPIEGVDSRTRRGRRFRDILDDLVAEHGCVSESDLARCRAAATMMIAMEDIAAQAVRGESVDPALTARLAGRTNRALDALGARARQRRRATR